MSNNNIDTELLYEGIVQDMHRTSLKENCCLSPTAKLCGLSNSALIFKEDQPLKNHLLPKDDVDKAGSIIAAKEKANVEKEIKNGICIHMDNVVSEDEGEKDYDNDDEAFQENQFDPNATFSVKTMKARRLSAFYKAIQESEEGVQSITAENASLIKN